MFDSLTYQAALVIYNLHYNSAICVMTTYSKMAVCSNGQCTRALFFIVR